MEVTARDVMELGPLKVVEQGRVMHRNGAVGVLSIEESRIVGYVTDNTQKHKVILKPKSDGGFEAECDCPGLTVCKHSVAVLQEAHDRLNAIEEEDDAAPPTTDWKTLAQNLQVSDKAPLQPSSWRIVFGLILRSASWNLHPYKVYIRPTGEMAQLVALNKIEPDMREMADHEEDILNTVYLLYGVPGELGALPTAYQSQYSRRLDYGEFPGRIFELLKGREIYLFDEMKNDIDSTVTVEPEQGRFHFALRDEGETYPASFDLRWGNETIPISDITCILTRNPVWMLVGKRLISVPEAPPLKFLRPLMEGTALPDLQAKEVTPFLERYLPPLSRHCEVELPDTMPIQKESELTERRVYVRENEGELTVALRVAYGPMELIPTKARGDLEYHRTDSVVLAIERDLEAEKTALDEFQDVAAVLLEKSNHFTTKLNGQEAMDWLIETPPKLTEAGFKMMGERELRDLQVNRNRPVLSLTIASGIDWFELDINIMVGDQRLDLKTLRKAINAGKRFVVLADGSQARLPEEWVGKLKSILAFAKVQGEKLIYQQFHMTVIDELLGEADQVSIDEEFQRRRQELRNFEKIETQPLPDGFQGELRPYQKAGFDWMGFLKKFHFGGCLADDMGLGKTIQTLVFLAKEYRDPETMPTLIIAPTSVVFNWERECVRFTPQLKVLNHTGVERTADLENFRKYNIILTTYGIMRRDIEQLREIPFHYVILDESQYIKNPLAQTAKAARLLQASNRLCLTGTPVENHTSELWSQFAFLNPGLLGSLSFFQNNFAKPIERQGDEFASERLRSLVKPFILRRTKQDVAKDLPEKTESVAYCEMNEDQQELYYQWRDYYRDLLLKRIDESGVDDMRMKILEGLLRLRQICCHPKLVEEKTKASSGKLDVFTELVMEVLSEDHKILIFSQFVKMLQVLKKELKKKKVQFEYLDGQTRRRQEHVDNFQENPDVKVFLISLKAGGAGLNLTAADYVIHYDPWWNPAVEQQATDRSYRIGQTRPVFTYKLITRNSVEEKILELQERKRELVEKLITTEKSLVKSLSREDVELLFS